jgi:hypothetical protein
MFLHNTCAGSKGIPVIDFSGPVAADFPPEIPVGLTPSIT